MNKKIILRALSLLGAAIGLGTPLGITASAEELPYIDITESTSWLDIQDLDQYMLVEVNPDGELSNLEPTLSPRALPYTEEELEHLLGGLPVYYDTGPFVLNRLNNLPGIHLSADGTTLRLGERLYRVRPSWETFQEQLENEIKTYQGDWSVYVKDLSVGHSMEINEHSMQSASLIKLYIAGATYEALENGTLTMDDEIRNALNLMITVSDNESSNVLVRRLSPDPENFRSGLAVVNDFIARNGFTNTEQINGIADPSLWVEDGRVNTTSAADCGRYLEKVYRGELVSHYASLRLEDLLNRQEICYKIADALPEGVHLSHKTGEESNTENDAAIVYTPFGDYILCIMSTKLDSTPTAVEQIHRLTQLVHTYFTEPITEITESTKITETSASAAASVPADGTSESAF